MIQLLSMNVIQVRNDVIVSKIWNITETKKNKENKEEFRLLVYSNCVSCENKK